MKHDRDYLIHTGAVLDRDGGIPVTEIHEVTRCKDCKHADVAYCRDHKTISRTEIYCIKDEHRHENHWFCADGERRADND